jgi:tRNA(adenine34) deaminase
MYWGKLKKIIWGAEDEKNGYKRITAANWPFHPKTEVVHGILRDECGQLMTDFFKKKR